MRKLMISAVAAAGVAALAAGSVQAHFDVPATVDVSKVTAGTYTADAGHSMVTWQVSHLGFNDYLGIFGDVAGTLTLDPANVGASKVDVTIPIASVVVPSAGLKDHLLRAGRDGAKPDFFGPSPTAAHFVSTSVTATGPTTATIVGDLTLNGVTKPVTIKAGVSGVGKNGMSQKETVGFHGEATIKRSEFGIPFGTQFGISDDTKLAITIAFEK